VNVDTAPFTQGAAAHKLGSLPAFDEAIRRPLRGPGFLQRSRLVFAAMSSRPRRPRQWSQPSARIPLWGLVGGIDAQRRIPLRSLFFFLFFSFFFFFFFFFRGSVFLVPSTRRHTPLFCKMHFRPI